MEDQEFELQESIDDYTIYRRKNQVRISIIGGTSVEGEVSEFDVNHDITTKTQMAYILAGLGCILGLISLFFLILGHVLIFAVLIFIAMPCIFVDAYLADEKCISVIKDRPQLIYHIDSRSNIDRIYKAITSEYREPVKREPLPSVANQKYARFEEIQELNRSASGTVEQNSVASTRESVSMTAYKKSGMSLDEIRDYLRRRSKKTTRLDSGCCNNILGSNDYCYIDQFHNRYHDRIFCLTPCPRPD